MERIYQVIHPIALITEHCFPKVYFFLVLLLVLEDLSDG